MGSGASKKGGAAEASGSDPASTQKPAAGSKQEAVPAAAKVPSIVASLRELDDDDPATSKATPIPQAKAEMKRPPRPGPPAALTPVATSGLGSEPKASHAASPSSPQSRADSSCRQEKPPVCPSASPASAVRPTNLPVVEYTPERLFAACRAGEEDVVQAFILQYASGTRGLAESEDLLFDAYGDSVLHHAVQGASLFLVKLLLNVGKVPADIPNARNETALQVVCRRGDMQLAQVLIEAKADANRRDSQGLTSFLACLFGCKRTDDMMESLLSARAEASAQDARGVGGLHFAALHADLHLQEWLLDHKASVDAQTERNTTALMLAAKRGHVESAALLLRFKANTTLTDEAGCSALMHALSNGHSEVAACILGDKGNSSSSAVELRDCAGRSALFHAVLGGQVAGLLGVLKVGARVNTLDEEGKSPLYQACLMGASDLVKCLLDADADPNLAGRASMVRPALLQDEDCGVCEGDEDDRQGALAAQACLQEARTCLQICATLAHNDLLTSLLEHSADINDAPGALSWTSLHLCAAVGNSEGASVLLTRGAALMLRDAEGNTAEVLAERAGNDDVLERLRDAAAMMSPAHRNLPGFEEEPRRRTAFAATGSLPPIHAVANGDNPMTGDDEVVNEPPPLEYFAASEWQRRPPNDSPLDRFCGPMVHDALRHEQWRIRWEAFGYLANHLSETVGSPEELVTAVSRIVAASAKDKAPKVFVASLSLFEEVLSDPRADVLSGEEFTALLCGRPLSGDADCDEGFTAASADQPNLIVVFLDQAEAGGGSSAAGSPQQAAADTLCSCVLHGRVALDELAYPLLARMDDRLRMVTSEKSKEAKCLVANLRLLSRWLSAFGLQNTGLFRRALVLPALLRGAASEHSKVRGASCQALSQIMSLSGGLEEHFWELLPTKARKAAQRLLAGQQGVTALAAVACEEDAMPKSVIVSEEPRAERFVCMSDLTPAVWATLDLAQAGGKAGSTKGVTGAVAFAAKTPAARGKLSDDGVAKPDDAAAVVLNEHFTSKDWKRRAEAIAALAGEFASYGPGVQLVDEAAACPEGNGDGGTSSLSNDDSFGAAGGPMLAQYVLRGHRLSTLQASLCQLLADSVTAVFVAACGLLRLTCGHVPLYIAPVFLEPVLLPLLTRLLDTSKKVQAKATETVMEIAALHSCALTEMIVQCASSASAWNTSPVVAMTPANGSAVAGSSQDTDRTMGPRLQLVAQLMEQARQRVGMDTWTPDTWNALANYAMKASGHRSNDVRQGAVQLLNSLRDQGDTAALIAERSLAQLEAIAQQRNPKRPGTSSTRMTTGRLGTSSRLGTGATLNQSGRLSTSQRLGTSSKSLRLGTSARLGTGLNNSGKLSNLGSSGRLGTAARSGRGLVSSSGITQEEDESDNSIHSESRPAIPEMPGEGEDGEGGVAFFNVETACPGADLVPDIKEGEAALREALPRAEPLDDIAMDFVAPLIALFGEGWTKCFYSHHWECRVAALFHLSASISARIYEAQLRGAAAHEIGELLDGSMRTVHEGMGDQNVQVYAEACRAVTVCVPVFCGLVDGRLLVAHLAPLLRQLCARMGDVKDVVRAETTQTLFKLLRPPVGDIVTPLALSVLILRHLMPLRESTQDADPSRVAPPPGKGSSAAWLCRIQALRIMIKENPKKIVAQPGSKTPGEWLRLQDGMLHSDPIVRNESARLYALICKATLRSQGDLGAQMESRESWVAVLPETIGHKVRMKVRRSLRLPEHPPDNKAGGLSGGGASNSLKSKADDSFPPPPPWEIPKALADWVCCSLEVLAPLRLPSQGEERVVIVGLNALAKTCSRSPEENARLTHTKVEEAFPLLCKAAQQALASPASLDRHVFIAALELIQSAVEKLAPRISGLDLNMGLAKTFPVLMERSSLCGDVKIAVASDKLVQYLAKHPKVGCEAVTKMVINSIAKSTRVQRPTMMLHMLLSEFGIRLCGQPDIVRLFLQAVSEQLERIQTMESTGGKENIQPGVATGRPQLISVLCTCNQFSPETVRQCMVELSVGQRKLINDALKEAPNPKLIALGASAAEQPSFTGGAVGSAVRAASRSREASADSPRRIGRHSSFNGGSSESRNIPPGLPRQPSGNFESLSPAVTRTKDGDSDQLSPKRLGRRDRSGAETSPARRRRRERGEDGMVAGSPSPTPPFEANGIARGVVGATAAGQSVGGMPYPPGASAPGANAFGSSPSARRLQPLVDRRAAGELEQRWPPGGLFTSSDSSPSHGRPPIPGVDSSINLKGRPWKFKPGDQPPQGTQATVGSGSSEWERQRQANLSGTADARILKGSSPPEDSLGALINVLSKDNPWKTQ